MRLQTSSGEIVIEIPETAKKIVVLHSATIDSTLLLYMLLNEIETTKRDVEVLVVQKGGEPIAYNCSLIKACHHLFFKPKTEILPPTSASLEAIRALLLPYIRRQDVDFLFTSAYANPPPSVKLRGIVPTKPVSESEKVKMPFLKFTKAELIKAYYDLGIQDMLKFTRTCGDLPYGACGHCFFCNERKWAFEANGQVDIFSDPDWVTPDYFRQVS